MPFLNVASIATMTSKQTDSHQTKKNYKTNCEKEKL